jgi:two-component system sensor histidine kinase PilS (NtrC family)
VKPLTQTATDTHRLLGIYIYYRLSLALLLGVMHWTGLSKDIFGSAYPDLFSNISLLYIAICALSAFLYWTKALKTHKTHLMGLLVCDFIALVLMMHAGGNLSGGLGYLLLIPMAVGSTFLRPRSNIGLAAFGTLLVLSMNFFNIKQGVVDSQAFFSAGLTGVSLFVTAIAFGIFSEKVQISEYTALKQTEQADFLELISQHIVETMRTGIIVVDRDLHIQLINNSAALLLNVDNRFNGIKGIPPVYEGLRNWQNDGIIPSSINLKLSNTQTIQISFAPLDDPRFPSLMLFIEDTQRLNQEAQQLKLASLGRLTASIAHEIRNPLGAISHAGQLLDESPNASASDKKLIDIIYNHSQRINFIINNILQFSRRNNATPEILNLNQWVADFKADYLQHHSGNIKIEFQQRDVYAKIDRNHLYQILTNLIDNGMRYSQKRIGREVVSIRINVTTENQRPYIEIIDYGMGIRGEKVNNIFEPFFTTEDTGSGLGLYLCKELSEANQANLSYSYDVGNSISIFKLILSHPQRRIELE